MFAQKFSKFAMACWVVCLTSHGEVIAQVDIEFDGTFRSGQLIGNDVFIDPAPASRAGSNQFYSFSRFNLPGSSSATFRSDGSNVNHVFARVTGLGPSTIDGNLVSEWQGAHFFFMNPRGVIFGDGASVDMAGSFTVTTADYIQFSDGLRLEGTTGTAPPLLSVGDPVAFGFMADTPAPVSFMNAYVTVPAGETINVIAGDISIDGSAPSGRKNFDAPGGGVTLVSVASPGTVHYRITEPNSLPELEGFTRQGEISVQNATIDSSAASPGGGRIVIRGGQLVVIDSRISSDSSGDGTGQGIDIDVGGEVALHGSATITSNANDAANAGHIKVRAGSLTVASPGVLSPSFTLDQANLFGGITAANRGSGEGGNIDVHVDGQARIEAGGLSAFSVLGDGSAGDVALHARDLEIVGQPSGAFSGVQSVTAIGATGTGGDVYVGIDQLLELRSGGSIRSSTFSDSDGGDTTVTAGSIAIDGENVEAFTGITSQSNAGIGDTGNVSVTSRGPLEIRGGGRISTNTATGGDSGAVTVKTGSLLIDGSGTDLATGITAETSAPNGGGRAGAVLVEVAGYAEFYSGGRISAETTGDGDGGAVAVRAGSIDAARRGSQFFTGILALSTLPDADGAGGDSGDIDVRAGRIRLSDGSLIDSSTFGSGTAGSVKVQANEIEIDRAGSEFFTGIGSDSDGSGRSGRVDVDADRIALRDGGLISTAAFLSGAAGDVSVRARQIDIAGQGEISDVVVTPRSGIVAATGELSTGAGGSVQVETGSLNVHSDGLVGANTAGSGDAGSVSVAAGRVDLRTRGEIGSRSTGTGNAGSVDVDSSGDITLQSGGRITVEAESANAGSINVRTGGDLRMDRGSISAVAGIDGGDIGISANQFISLENGSEIVAEAGNDGGNVTLSDAKFAILNNSRISANAVQGTGGNIQVGTEVLLTNNSPITASSQFGADGTVRIDALFDLSGSLAELDDDLLDVSAQLQPRCSVRIAGETGSFILVGRGGLPTLPGRYMPSHQLLDLPK